MASINSLIPPSKEIGVIIEIEPKSFSSEIQRKVDQSSTYRSGLAVTLFSRACQRMEIPFVAYLHWVDQEIEADRLAERSFKFLFKDQELPFERQHGESLLEFFVKLMESIELAEKNYDPEFRLRLFQSLNNISVTYKLGTNLVEIRNLDSGIEVRRQQPPVRRRVGSFLALIIAFLILYRAMMIYVKMFEEMGHAPPSSRREIRNAYLIQVSLETAMILVSFVSVQRGFRL